MCFRPSELSIGPVECPECGKRIYPTNDQIPKKCPFCRTSIEGIANKVVPDLPLSPPQKVSIMPPAIKTPQTPSKSDASKPPQ